MILEVWSDLLLILLPNEKGNGGGREERGDEKERKKKWKQTFVNKGERRLRGRGGNGKKSSSKIDHV